MIAFLKKPEVSHSILAAASGLLLAMSFPPACQSPLAWFALVPLLYVIMRRDAGASFKYGMICGLTYWLFSLSWLLTLGRTGAPWILAVMGWFFLALYCAFYIGVFAWLTSRVMASAGISGIRGEGDAYESMKSAVGRFAVMLAVPAIWTGLEYTRSSLFTGFSWNQLGISQFTSVTVIQIAGIFGVYGVSALIMLVNVAILFSGVRMSRVAKRRKVGMFNFELTIALLALLSAFVYGMLAIKQSAVRSPNDKRLTIAAVQPSIQQLKKWPEQFELEICETLKRQTEYAMTGRPDLIIWPETSLPALFPNNPYAAGYISQFTANGSQLLFGAMEEGVVNGKTNLYNTTFLVKDHSQVIASYRKRHLVPFGEYIPFSYTFSILEKVAPLGFNCYPGTGPVLLPAGSNAIPCGPLICFEDAFPYLARQAVKKGAKFLVNQTNDAWFEGTCGSIQHMSHCVFRCVENAVPAVRSANNGVTCFIDSVGSIDMLSDAGDGGDSEHLSFSWLDPDSVSFEGFKLSEIRCSGNTGMTLYTRYGDWMLAQPCALAVLLLAGWYAGMARIRTFSKGRDIAT